MVNGFRFSKRSKEKLKEAEPLLRELMTRAIMTSNSDFSVICGHRTEEEQNEAYRKGYSKLKYPRSKHNKIPSMAVDVVPYPLDWSDIASFKELAEHIKSVWSTMEYENATGDWELVHGGDWKMRDYPHWELRKKKQ